MLTLDGKVAIITGAAMGMGKSTAELFAELGAKVVVADYNEEEGNKVVDSIKKDGGEAAFVKVDVSNEEQVKHMVQFTVDTYGKLDVAVNNAAITPDDKPVAEMDMEYYDKLMAVDLKGVILCMKYELQQMEKDGTKGSIINTSSVSGIRPQPGTPAYIAAKHAVIGVTKSAAMDYSPKGIRVNSVAPGAIDTPMLRGALDQFGFDPEEYAKQLSMLNRFAQAEEVAQANAWLASDLSSYVTGTVMNVDGGYTSM
ncbi:2,5-dichloro-2,5-cyclohexadiene-1,4-diol dehydrogenase [Jeotgalicoccus saudimassiliensis]|uniref:Diacetyl reductase [(S)-acetoin forming] n=1 Tax=Jeotgalicoccus saudimassiliensis TaxID=1461582 RepID=A0A078M6V6_9STAP|nr:glucose 1-dehydrogenase [Jeotgalicoccus saudimassiliensis]CEA03138.1 2,5-dichloro-2,5-cyclohexadiene-1,4-diol dehydrogenase [Jeotgalicoccus saudimassiliensis]